MVDESIQPAVWGTAVPAQVLDQVEQVLGLRLPESWCRYVRRDKWLREIGILLGGDGSRDMYCLTSSGWEDAAPLHLSVAQFVAAIDEGSFRPYPQG